MFWFCWCSTSGWYVQFQEFKPSTWYWSCCSQPHSHSSTLGLWPTALQSLSKSWVLWICGFHWMLVSLLCVISLLCSPPHNFCILLLTSFTYVHDSPAHMYMPQLFTHCLLTIICVMWMIVTYVINLPLLLWYTLFNWNIMRLFYSFFSPWSHFICYFLTCVYWCILLAF